MTARQNNECRMWMSPRRDGRERWGMKMMMMFHTPADAHLRPSRTWPHAYWCHAHPEFHMYAFVNMHEHVCTQCVNTCEHACTTACTNIQMHWFATLIILVCTTAHIHTQIDYKNCMWDACNYWHYLFQYQCFEIKKDQFALKLVKTSVGGK